jgi:hypothetical protein
MLNAGLCFCSWISCWNLDMVGSCALQLNSCCYAPSSCAAACAAAAGRRVSAAATQPGQTVTHVAAAGAVLICAGVCILKQQWLPAVCCRRVGAAVADRWVLQSLAQHHKHRWVLKRLPAGCCSAFWLAGAAAVGALPCSCRRCCVAHLLQCQQLCWCAQRGW